MSAAICGSDLQSKSAPDIAALIRATGRKMVPRSQSRGWRMCASRASVRREAVEQAVAAGALEIVLAAAAVRPSRGMRRVPGLRRVVVAQALPVVMPDHRGALAALGPVAAGAILTGRERGAVGLRSGQDVVHV